MQNFEERLRTYVRQEGRHLSDIIFHNWVINVSKQNCIYYRLFWCWHNFFILKVNKVTIIWKTCLLFAPPCTIRRMRFACWIPKATNTHSGCVRIMAFVRQQWLHERSLMLHYTHIACPVYHKHQSYTKCSRHMTNKKNTGRLLLLKIFLRNTSQFTTSNIHSRTPLGLLCKSVRSGKAQSSECLPDWGPSFPSRWRYLILIAWKSV